MWKRTAKGLTLTFHLAGINNQNFLMRDDQTGTFWQQISGHAISGPLTGWQLEFVQTDELTFALWRSEAREGTVLKPLAQYQGNYASKDWEVKMAKARTVVDFPNTSLASRDIVLGVNAFGNTRAYPLQRILSEKLIEDRLGEEPIIVVVGPDEKSVRVFRARLPNGKEAPDYYRKDAEAAAAHALKAVLPNQSLFMDSSTGSEWSFAGCAVDGKLKGWCLQPISAIKDYWFNWRNYHPDTTIFRH